MQATTVFGRIYLSKAL